MKSNKLGRMIRTSFGARNFFIFAFLITVASISFTALFCWHQCVTTRKALVEEGQLLVKLLADNARLGVFSESPELLRDPIGSLFAEESVREVCIYNLAGSLLDRRERKDLPPPRVSDQPGSRAEVLRRVLETGDLVQFDHDDSLEFWAPVRSTSSMPVLNDLLQAETPTEKSPVIGFVSLDLTTSILRRDLTSLVSRSGGIGLFFLLTGSLIAYLVTSRITRPLEKLTENVVAFGQGGTVKPIMTEAEDEIGALAVAFNRMTESLEIREREKAVLEERLRQAQKLEAIGTLSGGIAHDFNNLMTVIKGYAEIILKDLAQGKDTRGHVERIVGTSNKAIALTRSLLTFSRKQVIDPKPLSLNESLRGMEKVLIRLAGKNIRLRTELAEDELIVMADTSQLDQVLMNLVTNARDAMPDGGVITISTRVVRPGSLLSGTLFPEGGGDHALMTVTDTGVGMSPEVRERIFDPFFTTKEVGRGTGLGLSTIFGIMRQNGWIIEVDSELGRGTTFRIFIPLLEAARAESAGEGPAASPGGTETILLAEDDREVRTITRLGLESRGYTVIEAADGNEAVARFLENRDLVRLLLFDVILPHRNGRSACQEIRKHQPDMKVIFFSGYPDDVVDQEGILLDGNMQFMSKPVSMEDLADRIRQVLDT